MLSAQTAAAPSSFLSAPAAEGDLSVKQVAAKLGVHEDTIYRAIKRGALPTIRVGRALRISREAFAAFRSSGDYR